MHDIYKSFVIRFQVSEGSAHRCTDTWVELLNLNHAVVSLILITLSL